MLALSSSNGFGCPFLHLCRLQVGALDNSSDPIEAVSWKTSLLRWFNVCAGRFSALEMNVREDLRNRQRRRLHGELY